MYYASTTDKRGRKRQTAMGITRQHAAAKVFNLDPKAKTCSTARAHQQHDGEWWNTGSSMVWHNRDEIIVIEEVRP